MPASSSENFVHIEETLRSSLNGAQKKVDSQIVSSAKRVLLNNIGFQPAKRAYAFEIDSLRSKYIPLNPSQPKLSEEHELLSTPKMTGKNSVGCDGLPHPKTILYPEEKIKLEWRRVHQIGSGLINMGNTCFLNSTLQCLTYTPPLVNYFLSEEHSQTCKQAGFCMMCELQRHIKRCYENSGNAIKPQAILQKLRMIAKHMHWGRQEDAHEFLRYVVDAMQRSSLNGYNKLDKFSKETTVVNQIFGGFLRSQVQCLVCKEKSDTYDPFLDISLEIKSVQSLERAFERYVQPETLDNDNAYMCLKCKRKVPAQKRFSVHKPPNVLTISLKRFDFHKMMGKVSRHIQFPEKLNLRPFMSSKQGEPVYYNLYAVLVHSGYACNSGHYYCYIKSPSKIWYCMNDSLVQQCSASRVLNSEAYLLFYIKSKPSVSQQSNGPLIGPKLPTNHSLGKNFKLVNGLKSHHVNDLGSPIERKVTSSTVIGPHLPNSQHTVSSSTSNNKPLPSNREKVTFGLNPLGVKNQNSGATGNKPRIVMQIKNGKVTTFEKSPNGKSKIVSGGEEKSKSKLVPYGDDSESDSENVHGNQAQQQKKASPVKIPPSASLIEKKKSEPVEIIFDKKLNTTTSVPGNANLLESSKVKGDHSHNRRIDSLNLMGHKSKVPQERSIDKTKSFCDTSGILCVSANHTKLKANSTDSKWQILHQDCAPSPSIGSNSSKDSVNSTSEWHVKDNTPVKSIAKTSGRPCPGWKIEQSTECNNHTKPAISECSSATSNSVSTEEKPTPHNGHHSAHSNISDRGDSVTKSAQIDHMYSNIMMKKDKSEIFNSVRKDKVDVSEKQGLICDNTGEGIKDKHKIKKQKKHKKHKKDYKEYKYQELVNESSSSMDMPVKKHKKKKHKHKKDSDNDSDIKKDGKRKSREEEDHREKRHKSNQDSEEYEWVEKTHKSMDSKPIPVQTWDYHIKDKIDRSKTDHRSEHWDGIKSSRVVEQLEKQSSLGYGSSVSSWEGGRSTVDQEVDLEREKERKRHWSEDYDDDLDRGKTKKVRKHHSEHNLYSHNAFQRAQDMKNEEKNKWNHGSNAHGSHSFTGHNRPFYSSQGHHESHHHGYHNDYRNRDTYNHRGSLKYGRR